ncbi:MAG: hypothetical protein J1F09_08535 [Oscillospiraceae bacterium]|nr:hypothetical protein [Oscillospiraceae bacterium]
MKKTRAIILLIIFGCILTSVVGVIVFGFVPKPFWWASLTVALSLHVAASVSVQRRYKTDYGLSARKFVLCGALPAVLIDLALFILSVSTLHKYHDFPIQFFLTELSLAYSVLYCVSFAAVLGTVFAARKIKERL